MNAMQLLNAIDCYPIGNSWARGEQESMAKLVIAAHFMNIYHGSDSNYIKNRVIDIFDGYWKKSHLPTLKASEQLLGISPGFIHDYGKVDMWRNANAQAVNYLESMLASL